MVATLTEVKRHKLLGGMSNMKQLVDLLRGRGGETKSMDNFAVAREVEFSF